MVTQEAAIETTVNDPSVICTGHKLVRDSLDEKVLPTNHVSVIMTSRSQVMNIITSVGCNHDDEDWSKIEEEGGM